jgi:hypothetical protein
MAHSPAIRLMIQHTAGRYVMLRVCVICGGHHGRQRTRDGRFHGTRLDTNGDICVSGYSINIVSVTTQNSGLVTPNQTHCA